MPLPEWTEKDLLPTLREEASGPVRATQQSEGSDAPEAAGPLHRAAESEARIGGGTSESIWRSAAVSGQPPLRYVYFYTPMCGTCKAGRRMLEVIAAMRPAWAIGVCDVNYSPALVAAWQIASVPTLAAVRGDALLAKRSKLEGVDVLYRWMAAAADVEQS